MAESKSGIGYVIYSPNGSMFLGRMGTWYSDVRMAQVYAEPRSARQAISRSELTRPAVVVEATISVRGDHIDTAVADAAPKTKVIPDPTPANGKGPEKGQPAKSGVKAA